MIGWTKGTTSGSEEDAWDWANDSTTSGTPILRESAVRKRVRTFVLESLGRSLVDNAEIWRELVTPSNRTSRGK